jgi:hypothetical protein
MSTENSVAVIFRLENETAEAEAGISVRRKINDSSL